MIVSDEIAASPKSSVNAVTAIADVMSPPASRAASLAGHANDPADGTTDIEFCARAYDSWFVQFICSQPLEQRALSSERFVRLQQVRAHLALGRLDGAEGAHAPVLATRRPSGLLPRTPEFVRRVSS